MSLTLVSFDLTGGPEEIWTLLDRTRDLVMADHLRLLVVQASSWSRVEIPVDDFAAGTMWCFAFKVEMPQAQSINGNRIIAPRMLATSF